MAGPAVFRVLWRTLCASSVAYVAACGGPRGACALITRAGAERLLKAPVGAPPAFDERRTDDQARPVTTCTYSTETEQQPPSSVTLLLAPQADSVTSRQDPWGSYLAAFQDRYGRVFPLEVVEGLGEGAVWVASSSQLTVYAKNALLTFTVIGADDLDVDAVKALAREAVARLDTPPSAR